MDSSKAWYLSKTLWVQVLGVVAMLLAARFPSGAEFIKSNFTELGAGWAIVNMVLRTITKDQITIV